MDSGSREMKAGATVLATLKNGRGVAYSAIITGFARDKDKGINPEVQNYVACWINVNKVESESAVMHRDIRLSNSSIDAQFMTRLTPEPPVKHSPKWQKNRIRLDDSSYHEARLRVAYPDAPVRALPACIVGHTL